jgi:hypothetical protein
MTNTGPARKASAIFSATVTGIRDSAVWAKTAVAAKVHQMLAFFLYPRMSRIRLLARLREPNHSALEFAFGLEPIVQLTALLFTALTIDFVRAPSDFLVRRGVPDRNLSRVGLDCFARNSISF